LGTVYLEATIGRAHRYCVFGILLEIMELALIVRPQL